MKVSRLYDLFNFFENHRKSFNSPKVEVVLPQLEILEDNLDGEKILRRLERVIRTAYQSFDKI
jgi:hypothetical protein